MGGLTPDAFDLAPAAIELVRAFGIPGFLVLFWGWYLTRIEKRHCEERHEWLEYIQRRDDDVQQMMRKQVDELNDTRSALQRLEMKIDAIKSD